MYVHCLLKSETRIYVELSIEWNSSTTKLHYTPRIPKKQKSNITHYNEVHFINKNSHGEEIQYP